MAKILYLTPWYPSERDKMAGLFVQKHVEAVQAQNVDVRVIHSFGWLDLWHQWCALRRTGWMPDLVQLNVIQKQGVLALLLKRFCHIPYIIIEHWSGYLPENGEFMRMSFLKKYITRRVAAQAELLLTVSPILEQAMQQLGFQAKQWGRAHNVVDDFFYEPSADSRQHSDKKTLLHISCFDERAKNVFGLLRAFRVACLRRNDVRLVLVGTGVDWLAAKNLAAELDFPEGSILFTGEQTPREVCEWLHRSDAFVLSSRYETAGIVLTEAAATGTPILSTPVGIATDIVTPETGLLVPCEIAEHNPRRFAEFIETILDNTADKKRTEALRKAAEPYSFSAVGKELKAIYDSCLHSDI